MIPSVMRGAVFLGGTEAAMQIPAVCWPQDTDISGLQAATRLALAQKSPVVCGGPKGSPSLNIASHLLVDGVYLGIVAVEVEGSNEQKQRAIMQLLQWGSAWFEFLVRRESSAGSNSLTTILRIVATSLEQDRFHAAATATATELAACMASDRVSIGFRDHRCTQVKAVSHSVRFSEKANLVRDIGMAMDEALDQQCSIVYPPLQEGTINLTCAHEGLSADQGNAALCTVPLGNNGRLYGAITSSRPFDEAGVELAEVIASVLGPILEIKRKEDRWMGAKIADPIAGAAAQAAGSPAPGAEARDPVARRARRVPRPRHRPLPRFRRRSPREEGCSGSWSPRWTVTSPPPRFVPATSCAKARCWGPWTTRI